jgi:hypothetical protein
MIAMSVDKLQERGKKHCDQQEKMDTCNWQLARWMQG